MKCHTSLWTALHTVVQLTGFLSGEFTSVAIVYPPDGKTGKIHHCACECTRVSSTSNAFIGLQNFQITRKTFLLNSAALLTQGASDELSYTTLKSSIFARFFVRYSVLLSYGIFAEKVCFIVEMSYRL